MKRIAVLLLAAAMLFSIALADDAELILQALDKVHTYWDNMPGGTEVRGVRVVDISPDADQNRKDTNCSYWRKAYKGTVCFVEFFLLTGPEPYPRLARTFNCVLVKSDGTMELSDNPIERLLSRTYDENLSSLISGVREYEILADGTVTLRSEEATAP